MTTVGAALIEEELAAVVRDYPLPGNPSERRRLRRQIPHCLHVCGLIASHCPTDGHLLSVEGGSGYVEILLKRHHGFDSIVQLSSRPSSGVSHRLAAFDIPLLECAIGQGPIPGKDGAFAGIVFPRAPEHLRSGLPHLLSECRRVLATDGVLLLGTSNVVEFGDRTASGRGDRVAWFRGRSRMFVADSLRREHRREPTERELTFLLGEAGFLIDKVRLARDGSRILAGLGIGPWSRFGRHIYFVARPA